MLRSSLRDMQSLLQASTTSTAVSCGILRESPNVYPSSRGHFRGQCLKFYPNRILVNIPGSLLSCYVCDSRLRDRVGIVSISFSEKTGSLVLQAVSFFFFNFLSAQQYSTYQLRLGRQYYVLQSKEN